MFLGSTTTTLTLLPPIGIGVADSSTCSKSTRPVVDRLHVSICPTYIASLRGTSWVFFAPYRFPTCCCCAVGPASLLLLLLGLIPTVFVAVPIPTKVWPNTALERRSEFWFHLHLPLAAHPTWLSNIQSRLSSGIQRFESS